MCLVGAAQIVEVLPHGQLPVQIDVIRVGQQLVELLLIGPVRALHLAVQLRRPWLDVHVPDACVFHVPVEARLPLVPTIGAHGVDPEGELLDDVVDEVDRALLVVPAVDLQRPDARGVVDRCVLIAADPVTIRRHQRQELHVDLDMVSRDLFGVAVGVDGPAVRLARQGPDPLALERAGDA